MKTSAAFTAGSLPRLCHLLICLAILFLLDLPCARAGEFHNSLSLQGFTGLLNIPNAEVTEEGRLYALFSDQREGAWRARTPRQENYMVSVGFFSIVELGGRITEAPGTGRDLSASVKVKVPFIPKGYHLPSLAFGMQDIGGGSKLLRTKYVVATEELWRLRLSLGYGAGPDRLDGVFGGAEFKASDWLYLVGEHDTRETSGGVRLVTPSVFGWPVNLNVTAKTSLDYRPGRVIELGLGLQFPLGLEHHATKPLEKETQVTPQVPAAPNVGAAKGESAGKPEEAPGRQTAEAGSDRDARLAALQRALVEAGFQNVRVGSKGGLLVIEYENARYNHNELDGLGVVCGIATGYAPPGFSDLRLIIRKKGLRILQLSAPVKELREFLRDAARLPELNGSLQITADVAQDREVRYLDGDGNPSWLNSTLVVYPGLKTFVATEVGVFDYLLSVKPDFYLNTWKGAVLNARWDIPVSWSDNFDDDGAFRRFRNNSRFERLMLFQAVRATPSVMATLGAGMILKDTYGTLNEVMWTPGSGAHRLRAKLGYAENNRRNSRDEVWLGSYRYYYSPLDTYLEGTGGRFWDQDTGFTLELKRFFGDTAFSAFYKDSRNSERRHVQVGGVQFAFPLTPRRDMKPWLVQARGSEEWSYAQETEIVTPGNRNLTGTSVGINPQPPFNLERVFYNRDRLTEAYIRKHLLRLRDANIRYN